MFGGRYNLGLQWRRHIAQRAGQPPRALGCAIVGWWRRAILPTFCCDDLETCAVATVIRRGRVVTEASFSTRVLPTPPAHNTIRLAPVTAEVFAAPGSGSGTPIIGIVPGKIITNREYAELPYHEGQRHADPSRDLLKICVLERHGRNGNVGRGFVHGFGLRAGVLRRA